jgi:hypothetical protein
MSVPADEGAAGAEGEEFLTCRGPLVFSAA